MADTAIAVQTDPAASLRNMFRQIGVLVALAATIAIGGGIALWAQTPNYTLLAGNMSARDITEIQSILQSEQIPYRVDGVTGGISVAASKVDIARMKLAAVGLPKSSSMGFELLQEEQGFGTSQFIEKARYQMALESELSRSISKLSNVRGARVHLAIPKQSVFAREKKQPSASVLIDLYPGRILEPGQVQAIAHMVAASVPNLGQSNVTVIDQMGRLLSGKGDDKDAGVTSQRFDYVKRLEDSYIRRIEDILSPIVGFDGVKAQVTAEIDFTRTERASESYNSDLPAIRSEQVLEENRIASAASGVPGALSNQPPGAATAPETTGIQGQAGVAEGGGSAAGGQGGSRRKSIRNYELDKTISHVQTSGGKLQRLSIAVVINNKRTVAEDGTATRIEYTPEEVDRFSVLVKETIGFNASRGDTVNVISADFTVPVPPEPLPEEPIWMQSWVLDLAKQLGGILVALIIAFGVLKPVMKSLLEKKESTAIAMTSEQQAMLAGGGDNVPALPGAVGQQSPDTMSPAQKAQALLSGPGDYDNELDQVKAFVTEEPKLAAQVVKNWVGAES